MRRFCTLFLLLSAFSVQAAAQSSIPFKKGAPPTREANSGDTYGTLTFDLLFEQAAPKKSAANFFDTFARGISQLFLKKDGQYILTIEAINAKGESIGRRSLMEIKRESSGFWIFNRVSKETTQTEWYGKLLSGALITDQNNDLRISVKSYYSETVKFDWGSFGSILDLLNTINVISITTPQVSENLKGLKTTLEKLISSYEVADITDIAPVSFVKLADSPPFPASGDFIVRYRTPADSATTRPGARTAAVRVKAIAADSRFSFFKNNKFEGNPFYETILAGAKIGALPVESLFSSRTGSGADALKKFLTDLSSDKGYVDADIGVRCRQLSSALGDYFSIPDRHAVYWALMNQYNYRLAKNQQSKECADPPRRALWTTYGLSSDNLDFIKSSPVVTTAVPSATRFGEINFARGLADVKKDSLITIFGSKDAVWQKIELPAQ